MDHIQVVRIGLLEVYQLLPPTTLLGCKLASDEEDSYVTYFMIRRSSPRLVCGNG